MSFRITGLDATPFIPLFGLTEQELAEKGVLRYRVTEFPGFPDRIEMRDVPIGETMLLLNHVSQPAQSPYYARHAIFVCEGATQTYDQTDEVPDVMASRLLSFRGFNADGMMHEGDVAKGETQQRALIARFFDNPAVDYIHAHNAGHGCYSGCISRA